MADKSAKKKSKKKKSKIAPSESDNVVSALSDVGQYSFQDTSADLLIDTDFDSVNGDNNDDFQTVVRQKRTRSSSSISSSSQLSYHSSSSASGISDDQSTAPNDK